MFWKNYKHGRMNGICHLSVVPVRKEPSDRSEMVTQLLFGEDFEILETKNQWRRIRIRFDDYEGWIDEKQFTEIQPEEYQNLKKAAPILTLDLLQLSLSSGVITPLLLGSTLPFYVAGQFAFNNMNFSFEGNVRNCGKEYSKKTIIENAMVYLNAPYLWGGRSPFGIDCSGLTQMSYKLAGVKLYRDAVQQSAMGNTLHLLEETVPGDLAFFDNEDGTIIHTGIILSENRIIHSSGSVRIDKIDHHGIFNSERNKYTHKLRLLKRIF